MSSKNYSLFLVITFLTIVFQSYGQEEIFHQKINQDMYGNFSEAFKNLDYSLFASIHSKEMIRISGSGGEIKKVQDYLNGYQKRWKNPKTTISLISFRLLERITSDTLVSDRGIYRASYTNDKNETKFFYGKFHVLLRLENNTWKILIDYDSDEKGTINQQSYDAAFSLSNYKKYWKNKN
ncbi:DUF4440 domain-containing protein [Aquimarina latercula]|uniref:DUF4440 domain-containing protein n=1 Tax=Aquimarina latercula TaxID=987 RepID=UPI0004075069|nr:DUF4440 domain-containing protein [Aquimarina latercula]